MPLALLADISSAMGFIRFTRLWVLVAAAALVAAVVTTRLLRTECPPDAGASPPILLDPGHGGLDGGAHWADLVEKAINLELALKAAEFLRQAGIPVRLTREADDDLGFPPLEGRYRRALTERLERAVSWRAAAMISIHINSIRDPRPRGFQVYYQPSSADSQHLAHLLREAMRGIHPRLWLPRSGLQFYLLRQANVPTVLVEVGFLSNRKDRELLRQEQFRIQVARAIAKAAEQYHRSKYCKRNRNLR